MKFKIWYILIGIYTISILALAYHFVSEATLISELYHDKEVNAEFEGNDWVSWKDTPDGVIAKSIHPLPSFKKKSEVPTPKEGDHLVYVDLASDEALEIYQSSTIDRLISGSYPGKPISLHVYELDEFTGNYLDKLQPIDISTGFRLPYGFNESPTYWRLSLWLISIGAFVSFIMMTILFPVIKGNWRENTKLMVVVLSSALFLSVQAIHFLYLIISSNLMDIGFEKSFIVLYMGLLFVYSISYFYYKAQIRNLLIIGPAILIAGIIFGWTLDIVFFSKKLKIYHDLIEQSSYIFFLIHVLTGLAISLSKRKEIPQLRQVVGVLCVMVLSALGLLFFVGGKKFMFVGHEDMLMLFTLLTFFPLFNSALQQLQFGKVSVVVTRTFQYLVFFMVSVIAFLLIKQLYSVYLDQGRYAPLLEIVTFLLTIVLGRVIYQANQSKFNRYFVSSQQEKRNHFNSFVAQIPQYTSSRILRKDVVEQLKEYFSADTVHLWWKGDEPDNQVEQQHHNKQELIYQELSDRQTVWSRNKEVAPYRMEKELEDSLSKATYSLVYPITVNEESYALLMLGKKKRGVYNLSDLELISRLVQQTQLTLNVLQLVHREKELIQQTYEANLTALRSQINPHFLFNTLNSLTELVHESADLAEEAIEKLAFIFRYTLKKSSQNFVALADEISLVSTYLDLEKIRFGKRLQITIDIAREVRDTEIPAFVIQTFVENCIKHGIAKILDNGIVTIKAYREGDFTITEVYDNGPGIDLSLIHRSTGLNNVIARLENIYELKDLVHFKNTGDGTLVTLRVPKVGVARVVEE